MDGAFGEYLNSNHGETESVEKDPIGMGLAFHLTKPRQTQNSTVLKHSIVQDVQGQTMTGEHMAWGTVSTNYTTEAAKACSNTCSKWSNECF